MSLNFLVLQIIFATFIFCLLPKEKQVIFWLLKAKMASQKFSSTIHKTCWCWKVFAPVFMCCLLTKRRATQILFSAIKDEWQVIVFCMKKQKAPHFFSWAKKFLWRLGILSRTFRFWGVNFCHFEEDFTWVFLALFSRNLVSFFFFFTLGTALIFVLVVPFFFEGSAW